MTLKEFNKFLQGMYEDEEKMEHIRVTLAIPDEQGQPRDRRQWVDLCSVGDRWEYIRLTSRPGSLSASAGCEVCVLLLLQRDMEQTL